MIDKRTLYLTKKEAGVILAALSTSDYEKLKSYIKYSNMSFDIEDFSKVLQRVYELHKSFEEKEKPDSEFVYQKFIELGEE